MAELGVKLDCKLKSIAWDRITFPMRSICKLEKLINELREENRYLLALKELLLD